jgi:site-specific DNA-methyltransferase (adenine-specific)
MKYQILQGDNRDTLKTIADNSIDAIVTDPPYGIDFLGKAWDANTGALETYQECLRVLKPGGHILAFSAARTYHHLAITLEQAGFEIRDQIMWIYSSGFPKSQDIGRSIQRSMGVKETKAIKNTTLKSKQLQNQLSGKDINLYANGEKQTVCTDPEAQQWQGWGSALKPAHEPIALARKPLHKNFSIAKNAQVWGTGALNIDATRIPTDELKPAKMGAISNAINAEKNVNEGLDSSQDTDWFPNEGGRFPSNVIGEILQADYQKYFYCPKVSRRERHTGFELPPPMFGNVQGCYGADGERFAVGFDDRSEGKTKKKKHDPLGHIPTTSGGMWEGTSGDNYDPENPLQYNASLLLKGLGNNHPTVKPIELMKYLIRLVTPPGGVVLDPFNGSGSTGCAAVELGYEYIGCELDPNYVEISLKRIREWNRPDNTFADIFE